MTTQFYLASRSPRRQELLRQLGLRFEVLPAEVLEQPQPAQSPADYAVLVALAKARTGSTLAREPLPVLGADTDVVLDGEILGKPLNREHGLSLLARLSGRTHEVYSAVAMVLRDRTQTALSVTRVNFAVISPAMASAYWDTGEPVGKAGAYAIQGLGARFVKTIEGSYSGVMGLPLYETGELLKAFGVEILPPHTSRLTPHDL